MPAPTIHTSCNAFVRIISYWTERIGRTTSQWARRKNTQSGQGSSSRAFLLRRSYPQAMFGCNLSTEGPPIDKTKTHVFVEHIPVSRSYEAPDDEPDPEAEIAQPLYPGAEAIHRREQVRERGEHEVIYTCAPSTPPTIRPHIRPAHRDEAQAGLHTP